MNEKSPIRRSADDTERRQVRDRLELLRSLLSPQGSLWISIDDNECHYLKVLCDEVFGRHNFVSHVIWQKIFSPNSTARHLSDMHDHILVYAASKDLWQRNLMPREDRPSRASLRTASASATLHQAAELLQLRYGAVREVD